MRADEVSLASPWDGLALAIALFVASSQSLPTIEAETAPMPIDIPDQLPQLEWPDLEREAVRARRRERVDCRMRLDGYDDSPL